MREGRLRRVREAMAGQGLRAMAVFSLPNIRYLAGFSGSSAVCLITAKEALFFTDFRYRTQAAREVRGFERLEHKDLLEGLSAEVRRRRIKHLGFEGAHLSYAGFRSLKKRLRKVALSPTRELLERVRLCKEPGELTRIRRAVRIAAGALEESVGEIRPGRSEKEVALSLEFASRRLGSEGPPFDFIVAGGPRGALPHGRASERRLRKGEMVSIDFGAIHRGYNSDLTRTFALGRPSKRLKEVYQAVLDANGAALEAVRPGASAKEVDGAARGVIERAGFGCFFGHGTGHGVGLEVHEMPRISPGVKETLQVGMVITIEPGVYIPRLGGARIEDMVVVTPRGGEVLTAGVSKELQVL